MPEPVEWHTLPWRELPPEVEQIIGRGLNCYLRARRLEQEAVQLRREAGMWAVRAKLRGATDRDIAKRWKVHHITVFKLTRFAEGITPGEKRARRRVEQMEG